MSPMQSWVLTAFIYFIPHSGFTKADMQAGAWKWDSPNTRWDKSVAASEITHPSRLVGQNSGGEVQKQQLDTRVRNDEPQGGPSVHLAQVSFVIHAFGSAFILDLKLNHHLLSSRYMERHYERDGNVTHISGVAEEHCYYQGKIRGNAGSVVALSSCLGLYGVFSDGYYMYIIEPQTTENQELQQEQNPHLIHRTPALLLSQGCTEQGCQLHGVDQNTTSSIPKLRRKRQVQRIQHTVQTEMKYIELTVVNDHQLFEQLRQSVILTNNFAKSVVNLADAIYREQLNTRIVLVAMETWASADRIRTEDDPLLTLGRFMKYRRESLQEPSDAVHLFSGRTFQSSRSGTAYFGGICSMARGGGVNEYGNVGTMAITLAQTLGQNVGMMWNKQRTSAGDCKCPDSWLGCIMEDTGYYLPQKFSRCSIDEYNQFLQDGGGWCLSNKPVKLLDSPECGNGFVEAGEECDCGSIMECARLPGGKCCKKCTLTYDAMCSDGLCCKGCKYEPRGMTCRESVNECDVPEMCPGDSSQCPPNLHKLDGYACENEQGRCYGGRCKTRDRQCSALWGRASADRFCYEKLNIEGTEKGNCGRDGQNWIQCNKQDVLCGYLLCSNITGTPKIGDLSGEITSMTFYHQSKYVDCRGGQVLLVDGFNLGYVDDGTPCGPNMMCLNHRCLPMIAFNFSSCPSSWDGRICYNHGVCSNEGKCICNSEWTGKDCSVFDPLPQPTPTRELEKYKGPSGTNIIIGAIAGAVLVAAIVLGGTGWGFKNIRRGRSGGG